MSAAVEPLAVARSFDVEGMHCQACASKVQRTLAGQAGVREANVNLALARARLELLAEFG